MKRVKLHSRRSQKLVNMLGCILSWCLCGGVEGSENIILCSLVVLERFAWTPSPHAGAQTPRPFLQIEAETLAWRQCAPLGDGHTDACDDTYCEMSAKNINLDKSSHKREKSFDPFILRRARRA